MSIFHDSLRECRTFDERFGCAVAGSIACANQTDRAAAQLWLTKTAAERGARFADDLTLERSAEIATEYLRNIRKN